MNKSLQLDPSLIGKKFTGNLAQIEYICVGFAQNETFLVFGAINDPVTNRFEIKSLKLTEVKFQGQM